MKLEKSITIINKLGLHARAASKLVGTASRYESQILLNRNGQQADAKSIMSILMLAASQGTELQVTVNGADAEEAWHNIETLINNRFDEAE
ncbi:MAG: phosphocarrier protein HPr [Pseudomonadales bacterium]|jgi:phosphotransferase system HPr (HPr) family protein|uniref:HPr family phosphocarrier protein n=1 Tax=unclassified Ketobacter TaxID=2639109 RepID=UPI000C62C046|nr:MULTISPECIES: HPr family phosphocarrier protein [unclassified Ketobacter]MAA59451.1 phosphocarrier protein HPr [Pseudomonadales bacterium]MEC8811117.1 HPr family phosphocarrier protein [Pseudomonadota bacterium]TNC88621.1 MAG: phosphocarrier protein HPr [Alcanivorax sp.]HAG93376.1 HPr family phosphocarrier protein [Gammaproteobacteria bacterium]MAQ25403.1 phosphocarrier protein HPr [Pseudomonadales bacterium]|tara:strand:+ start:2492 stop:2764 length:273 start_codon:yes stop_codon:yes gene_type:complete